MLKNSLFCAVTVAALFAAPLSHASEAIVKKARCVACHQIDKKAVGPSYKDVAAKYQDKSDAVAKLSDKVRSGGSGVWGEIPMPPHPADKLSDADLKAAIEWVLSLK